MTDYLQDKLSQRQKVISVLHEITKEDFSVSDDTILDKLYDHIETSTEIKGLIESLYPEIVSWLETIVNEWEERKLFYGVKIFVLRLLGYVCSSAEGFNIGKEKSVLSHIHQLVLRDQFKNDPSLTVHLINTLGMLLKHQDGWTWLTETMIWKYAVTAYYENRSIYIKRASVKFMSKLLSISVTYNGRSAEILTFICEPLIQNNLLTVKDVVPPVEDVVPTVEDAAPNVEDVKGNCEKTSEKKQAQSEENIDSLFVKSLDINQNPIYSGEKVIVTTHLIKSANYLCDVLDDLISADAYIPEKLFLVYRYNGVTEESVIVSDILKHCSVVQGIETFSFLLLKIQLRNAQSKENEGLTCALSPVYQDILNVIKCLVAHYKYQVLNNIYVFSMRAKMIKRHLNCQSCQNFEKALIADMLTCLHPHSCRSLDMKRCSFYQIFVNNVIVQDDLVRMTEECCCSKRKTDPLNIKYIQSGLFALKNSIPFFSLRSANTVLSQAVRTLIPGFYYLKVNNFLPTPLLIISLNLINDLMEVIGPLNWCLNRDLNMYSAIISNIREQTIDARVLITTLKVLITNIKFELVYENMLTGDGLDYLIDTKEINQLSLLRSILKSVNWEVRDTTLEVYHTMMELGETSFWIFISLFDEDLVREILEMARNDDSSYVRASALNFFSKCVRAKFFKYVTSPIICSTAVKVLLEDEMPVARRAACELLTALYIANELDDIWKTNGIYEVMFDATTKDLDWEVKRAALLFWHCAVDKHLMEENVPIISLPLGLRDKFEIISQIKVVLTKLSETGCLKAIWLGVNDDCDLKVCEEAQNIINYLEDLNKQWNYVDDIVNCDEFEETEVADRNKASPRYMKVKEFLLLIQNQEWRKILDSRRVWIETTCDDFTSLLDHILSVNDNQIDDHNAVDCY